MKRLLLFVAVAASLAANASAQQVDRAAGHQRFKGKPTEQVMQRGASVDIDVRDLPEPPRRQRFRPERHDPKGAPVLLPGGPAPAAPIPPERSAPAPSPNIVFEGLDREELGFGSPPDTNGDVGPVYYIQSVNAAVGIYRKSDGFREAGFTFDALMSQGNFGNMCDTDNFGDPVVLYDTFEDRWILTDFAFQLDASDNVFPEEAYQCFAVSKTGDPVAGGWNFYSIETLGGLGDYPKFGIWPDGLYMTTSMFDYAATGGFQNPRVYAFNKAQMYAGDATVQVVSFDGPASDFTILPANARLQTGTPPAGAPNYYVSTWQFLNALSVYKFHVDWTSVSLSSFTGPDVPLAATSWPNANVDPAPQPGTAMTLDTLPFRAMMQNQYTRIGGTESLWVPHTVRRANTAGAAAPRWYQVDVTGGTVAANLPQAATWDPDGNNTIHRYVPSLAVDRAGNMAMGYSTSGSTAPNFPSIKYAGRLSTDPINTFSQTEQTMFAGTASQTGSNRWGDYAAMSVDPDGCTFWFTSEYANPLSQDFDKRWKTKIGSFNFSPCTPVGSGGTVSGTVTVTPGGAPLSGATVRLGVRSTTTNGAGFYSFTNIPAGTYPSMSASAPGYGTSSTATIPVADGGTTTRNFALAAAASSGCFTDTTQADFQTGEPTNVDLTTSPGNARLASPDIIDQQNTTLSNSGFGFTNTTWLAQTFTAALSGTVKSVDLNLFSLNCSAVTMPNITVSIRNAAGNEPTGADLATATIAGFCSGGGGFFKATFASPATVVAGTQYAVVFRAAAAVPGGSPAPGYFGTVSAANPEPDPNPYAGGRRATSTNSGASWTGASGNNNNDHGFKIYVNQGFAAAGHFVSSLKDANPAVGSSAAWTTISWNGTTPANTALRFQVAASTAMGGPFNYVGPDGTAATFYTTSGGSLTQFNGKRYLRYKAYLSTTNTAVTPTLADVTVCFANALQLTVSKAGNGSGTVTSSPAGINCGATCSAAYASGTPVTLTATPDTGSTFTGWSGDCTGTGACNVTMSQARSVTATFAVETHTLTVSVTGNGTVTGSGINCPGDCSETYDYGTVVSLTATPNANHHLSTWSGDCSGTGACSVTMTAARSVGATFAIETHTLTVSVTGNGTVTGTGINCPGDCSETYDHGTVVSLTATPDANHHLSAWSGDCTGTGACNVMMTAAKSVGATFAIDTHTLTVSVTGNGTVTGTGINCPGDCSETYDHGTVVNLTATPNANHHLSAWSDDCIGTGACSVTMTADRSVGATFAIDTHTLTVSVTGNGAVTGTGINCPGDCSETYDHGIVVSLTATPDANYHLSAWSGDCLGTGACSVTMNADRSVGATFAIDTHTLTVSVTGNGTVTGTGINCPGDCTETYDHGTVVGLTATPDANYHLSAWSSDCSGTGACSVTMTADRSVGATFAIDTHTLTVSVTGNGTVTGTGINCPGDCSETYDHGTVVGLTATPGTGAVFTSWSGACSGSGACNVTIDQDRSVSATFGVAIQTINLSKQGPGSVSVLSTPAGIDCGATCSAQFTYGTDLSLAATVGSSTPFLGYHFVGWTGLCTGITTNCFFTVNADGTVTVVLGWDYTKDDFETGTLEHWSAQSP